MVSSFRLLSVLSLALAVSTAGAQGTRNAPADRGAVRDVILKLASHVQAGDWDSANGLFITRDLHVLVDTTMMHQWPEYRDGFLKPELARYPRPRVAHTSIEVQVRGTVAWVAFFQEISSAAGAPARRRALGTAVLEKLSGRWIIMHLHLSR